MSAGSYPPLRALLISVVALAVPVIGAFWGPEALEDYEALLWILAVVPAFLLAYYKAWRGPAAALAGAMAAISVTYAIMETTGRSMPDLMLPIVVILIAVSLAIGALADRIYKASGKDGPDEGFTDPATGLPNRAHAELYLETEFAAATMGRSVTIVLFNIDNFKAFNARHGSIAGDEVVRIIAETLKKITRRTNLNSRFAEDEFLCILSGADENGAIGFVNRFQQTLPSVGGQRQIPPISTGIASIAPEMKSHHDLISASRTALRQAQKDGPGRVRVYGTPLRVPLPGESPAPPTGEPQPAPDARSVMPQGRGRGRKALIVAEQAPVRALLARYLADHGFNVTQVSNVVDGVQCLTNEFDLLFTDISLYEGIGVELVRAAKLRWASIQVIGLVQHSAQGNLLIETLNAGVDRYLVTPLDLQKVREHITDLLARRDRLVASVVQSRQLTMEAQARTNEAMQALRETEEEYRSVMRSVHEVIFRVDLEGRFTFLNDAWEEVTGQSAQASIGKPAVDFAHDRADFESALRAVTTGDQEKVRGEIRLRGSDGAMRWLELRARRLFDADNNVTGVSGTLEDVTARKQAEDRLRRSEAASRGLLAALPDEVLLVSREGVVLSHEGSGADRMHEHSAVGNTIEQVFPSAVAAIVRELMGRATASGAAQVHEYDVTEGEDVREFEVRVAPSHDDEVVAIIRNITQRKTLEEQLRQAQKLEAIGRLAGGLAHDFNNLLTVVQGNAHMISEEAQDNEAALEYVRQINTAADRGATLVRQLLAFGRKQVLQPSVLNVNSLVENTRSMLARLIGEHIRLEVDLDPDVGLVRADAGQIEQVLVNLAVNARDVMRQGGTLSISTRNGALVMHGENAESTQENMVLLTVTDNGPGMDAATLERVFEPFFTTKGRAEASGLGLATVYGIVRQSGGTISVSSEPGRGTTFEIALPRTAD